ncbi:hypothetical protein ACFVT2_06005 [Streptomyces sp. NPDC058000]|uniref:hypothetical protein n=1 Tax=Streptomyces sp. NPDC058000 TaxID=3346299 RepID=UPI0036E5E50C
MPTANAATSGVTERICNGALGPPVTPNSLLSSAAARNRVEIAAWAWENGICTGGRD